jgi:septal ring-binding cell division protein DamX
MRNSPMKRRVIGAAVTVLVLGVVGFAFAAWTSSGSGSGYAQAGTAQALTTSDLSGSSFTNKLYPGTNGDVNIKINNPNSYPVTVTSITGNGTIQADGTHQTAGCGTSSDASTTGVTFANQTGQSISVAANSNTTTTLNNVASMSNASVDACQGATFTIPVSVSGHSG